MSKVTQKEIRLSDQPRLGLVRTAQIAADGLRYRLFRAAVTVCVIAVAVAFLMNILGESLIKRRLAQDARRELAGMRAVHHWAARLTRPSAAADILAAAAAGADNPFIRILGDADAGARFSASARQAHAYLEFFNALAYDPRRTLIFTASGVGIFDYLRVPENMDKFATSLAQMPAVRLGDGLSAFQAFLDGWPDLADQLGRIIEAERAAIARLDAVRGDRTVFAALAAPDGALIAAARQAGFAIGADEDRLAGQAQAVLDGLVLERALTLMETRRLLARHFNLLPTDVTARDLWRFLAEPEQAAVFLERMAPRAATLQSLDAASVVSLAQSHQREAALERVARLTAGAGGGWLGLGERMEWLLSVSLLVCVIGISNAMLMSVTERFREIATMKCLGALDGFIMLLFVLEASFLGLIGGLLGALLGDLISFGRMAVIFGPDVFTQVPPSEILGASAAAIVVGVLLAAAASVYPSLKAASLAPMEAMRVE